MANPRENPDLPERLKHSVQSTERAVDAAITEATGLVQAMVGSRSILSLSVNPERSQSKALEAIAALSAAREAILATHSQIFAASTGAWTGIQSARNWSVLGAPTLGLIDALKDGLPLDAADRLAREIFPDDDAFRDKLIARSTYARRKAKGDSPLSGTESERIARISRLWAMAVEIWGSPEAARSFFARSHPLLGDRAPVDVALSGELGGRMVEDVLGRLAYGSAA